MPEKKSLIANDQHPALSSKSNYSGIRVVLKKLTGFSVTTDANINTNVIGLFIQG